MSLRSKATELFSWTFRNRLRGIQETFNNLRIRWVSGKPLSPAVQGQLLEHAYLRPTLSAMSEDSTWCVDSFEIGEDAVEMRGWALSPYDRYAPVQFTLNGVPFEEVDYPGERADVAGVFWYRLGAGSCAFVCRTPRDPARDLEDVFPDGFAELQFCDARTSAPFRADHAFFVAHPERNELEDPGSERRLRVHGNTDRGSFEIQGASAFKKIERALNKTCGKGYSDFPMILDWGCGCGRLTRYFEAFPGTRIHGTDIDADNIEWCKEHFPFGEFSVCDVDPPTTYADGTFDLIFAVSVMTHLAEEDRTAWLLELDRISNDDATVMLTVQGNAALCRSRVQSETLLRLRQRGAIDVDVSVAASDLSPEPTRYIDCFLTEDYIRHRWAEIFDVVDVIPGYIGNVQDLVILRKKARKAP